LSFEDLIKQQKEYHYLVKLVDKMTNEKLAKKEGNLYRVIRENQRSEQETRTADEEI
jgi:Na+-transporting NADH:ubiquinone oxidoreductase subunit NqrF